MATDVETANANRSSICQIGLVTFEDGRITDSWRKLINPEDYFDEYNVSVHGIDESSVVGAPTFAEVFDELAKRVDGQIVAHHTAFDRTAYERAMLRYNLSPFRCSWLDTSKVARRAWQEFARSGFNLRNVSSVLGIELGQHHDALSDARVAGEILLRAIEHTGLDVDGWLARVRQPINPGASSISSQEFSAEGNPEGPLFGEVALFTGSLAIPRRRAAGIAAEKGCAVRDNWSSKVTLLIVGDQDISRLSGHRISSKHRAALAAQKRGLPVQIVSESDFYHLVGLDDEIPVKAERTRLQSAAYGEPTGGPFISLEISLDDDGNAQLSIGSPTNVTSRRRRRH